jgi:hypothetical protein
MQQAERIAEMNALITAIALWLSANFALPMPGSPPRVEMAPGEKIAALHYGPAFAANMPPRAQSGAGDIVAVYDDASRTIYLREGWQGQTPAELSVVVHELVHHMQNLSGARYECPQEREKLAYQAQERWLGLFGRNLESEFGIDGFSLLVKTRCYY